ncbi:MAG: tyrosine-type recombinase/integrase [Armatimonadetes bacterium]|nr:tyrosine-type recombinase/integrase [Armatimonadota bacterium]
MPKRSLVSPRDAVKTAELERQGRVWLLDCEIRQLSPNTIALRRVELARFGRFLREEEFSHVDSTAARAFFIRLTEQQLRPASIRNYWVDLHTFFGFLAEEGIVATNPIESVPRPKVPEDQIRPFTEAQVKALLVAAHQSRHPRRDEALVLFLVDTAARASEVCGLRMKNLDLVNRRCEVLGKGNKRRLLPLSAPTTRALIRYIAEAEEERHPDSPVFLAEQGARMGEALARHGLLEVIRRLAASAGVTGVRPSPHTLRHTAAVMFLRACGNVFALKQLLGHTELRMVNRYVALAQADLEAQHRAFSPVEHIRRAR